MATIDNDELFSAMRELASNISPAPVMWSKPQIKSALQSIEDWFEVGTKSAKIGAAAAIETAAAGVFTNAQKKKIIRAWMIRKASRKTR